MQLLKILVRIRLEILRPLLVILYRIRISSTLEILRPLPFPLVIRLLKLSAGVRYRLQLGKRKRVIEWLSQVSPSAVSVDRLKTQAREWFTFVTFTHYLGFLLFLHSPERLPDGLIEVQGWDRAECALKRKKGVILLSSHVGFAMAERFLFRSRQPDILYLLRIGFATPEDRSVSALWYRWIWRRFNLDSGNLSGNEGFCLHYMKKALNHLRNNGIVNLAGDGAFGTLRYPVTICGRPHAFAGGAMALGLISGAPVLPIFTTVDTRGNLPRFHIEIQEPLNVSTGVYPAEQAQTLVEAYAARIAGFITRHPDNVSWPYLV